MKLGICGWILVKVTYSKLKYVVIRTISHSRILTSAYFAFSPSYRREQRALVSGLLSHMKDIKEDTSFFLLRRNIHRIEKGLVMPSRRPVFAAEYIGETVDYYLKALKNCGGVSREFDWATDVLHQYFASVESHPYVDKARRAFLEIAPVEPGEAVPYKHGTVRSPVTNDELLSLVRQRKSVRTFLQKPVPRELVDTALEIAALSPSSCNRQPTHYRIYDEGPLLREMARLPLGTAGFADNIPMICAVTGDLSAYFYERDRHSIYVDGCLSAMLFMLALETVGLASCPLNWAEIDSRDQRFEKMAGLLPHERAIMFMAIGYPDPEGKVAYSAKKDLSALRSYNQASEAARRPELRDEVRTRVANWWRRLRKLVAPAAEDMTLFFILYESELLALVRSH
ncbi:MAG: nitroreductase family protein [Gammaproteobacteria bacterium]|nr:nitroreductase family protein [Gammaproteobacteria bacterium]